MTTNTSNARAQARTAVAVAVLAVLPLPAMAQYKVVAPDGSITYTDRPPTDGGARVTPLGRGAAGAGAEPALPLELRQPAARYPVVLYAAADCAPCDSGRRLLQQRGIPYAERRVTSEEDAQALERAVGGRTVPALTIGTQALRGYSESDWSSYLDAAGYPRDSKLPRNWQPAAATPLVERVPAGRAAASTPAEAAPALPRNDEPAAPGGLRF